jgi:hypothetical protein
MSGPPQASVWRMAAATALVVAAIYLPQWIGLPWVWGLVFAPIAAVVAIFVFLRRPNQ